MKHFLKKRNINILVVDSGIGGISIANQLYNFFVDNRYFENVNIIYSDARFNKYGYNSMQSNDQKINVFSERLNYLYQVLKPDIIFVACNTLSVLLNQTNFFKKCTIPIIDILQSGLNIMLQSLFENKMLFILGTKTTIQNNFYKSTLIQYGFDNKMIINQLCPNLAKYIESSDHTQYFLNENIRWLTNRIIEKKNNENIKQFTVSFNCTHYYYVINKFKNQFDKIGYKNIKYICPNKNMIYSLTNLLSIQKYNFTNINFSLFEFKLSNIQKNKLKNFLNNNYFSTLI